jgi:hypothetical protein
LWLLAVASEYLGALADAYSQECVEKLSEKPHERANLLAIRRLIAV